MIQTKHGSIQTPAFVPVATKVTLKTIPPRDLKEIGVQVAFMNTLHLTVHPGVEVIKKCGAVFTCTALKKEASVKTGASLLEFSLENFLFDFVTSYAVRLTLETG